MRLTSLIAGETPLKPIKKQQLTITPFLYLNRGLIEIRKSVAPAFRRAFGSQGSL